MKNFIKCIILFPVLLLLAACAIEPQRQALSLQNKQDIRSNKTLLNTTQNGIRLEENYMFSSNRPDPYDLMDGGYIVRKSSPAFSDAILDAYINTEIQKHDINESKIAIAPVRNALGNFNYINYFKSDLQKNLSSLPWLKLQSIKVQYNIKRSEQEIVNTAKANTTLLVGTTYALNSTFERLEVVAYVKLDAKSKNGKAPNALYNNIFYYIYYLQSNNKKINMPIWIQNNASFLKSKLRDASAMLSNAITTDINNPNGLSGSPIVDVRTIYGIKDKAKVISKKDGYYVLSLINGGAIYIVNQLN